MKAIVLGLTPLASVVAENLVGTYPLGTKTIIPDLSDAINCNTSFSIQNNADYFACIEYIRNRTIDQVSHKIFVGKISISLDFEDTLKKELKNYPNAIIGYQITEGMTPFVRRVLTENYEIEDSKDIEVINDFDSTEYEFTIEISIIEVVSYRKYSEFEMHGHPPRYIKNRTGEAICEFPEDIEVINEHLYDHEYIRSQIKLPSMSYLAMWMGFLCCDTCINSTHGTQVTLWGRDENEEGLPELGIGIYW